MTIATAQVSRCAAPASSYSDLELSQLHAQAENALSVALWHLRQPSVNVSGAARKAVQALDALGRLRRAPSGTSIESSSSARNAIAEDGQP